MRPGEGAVSLRGKERIYGEAVEDPEHCECARQSIPYFLHQSEPPGRFEVEILETVFRGSRHCRFRIEKQ